MFINFSSGHISMLFLLSLSLNLQKSLFFVFFFSIIQF